MSLKTSNGSAKKVTELPRLETVWPAQNLRKSAETRRRGPWSAWTANPITTSMPASHANFAEADTTG